MAGPHPPPITLTSRQDEVLTHLARRHAGAHRLVQRSQIILCAAAGGNNEEVARELDLVAKTVRTWRNRWLAAAPQLAALEAAECSTTKLLHAIEATFADEPRSGTPVKFSAEAICSIIALACEPPAASGRPVTHWTPPELAAEAINRGIVETISSRTVGRVLKRGHDQTASGPLLAHQ
jgi:hypothetical protein